MQESIEKAKEALIGLERILPSDLKAQGDVVWRINTARAALVNVFVAPTRLDLNLIDEALCDYLRALRSGELDGAGHFRPEEIEEQAALVALLCVRQEAAAASDDSAEELERLRAENAELKKALDFERECRPPFEGPVIPLSGEMGCELIELLEFQLSREVHKDKERVLLPTYAENGLNHVLLMLNQSAPWSWNHAVGNVVEREFGRVRPMPGGIADAFKDLLNHICVTCRNDALSRDCLIEAVSKIQDMLFEAVEEETVELSKVEPDQSPSLSVVDGQQDREE